MNKLIRAGNKNYNTFHFSWTITNWCNYSCTYCSAKPVMVEKWNKSNNMSNYKLTLVKLKKFDAPFDIELYGGEPTLHTNLKYILEELSEIENCKRIEIITNLSRSLSYFKDLNIKNVSVCASYHPQYHDVDFITKLEELKSLDNLYVRTTVNLIDDKKYWPQTLEFIKQLKNCGVDFNLHYLNDTPFWKSNYTEEFFETFKPLEQNSYKGKVANLYEYEFDTGIEKLQDLEIYRRGLHKFKGFVCKPLFFEIDFEGNVRNMCTRKEFKSLLLKSSELMRNEICPCDFCPCESMFNFYKVAK